MTSFQSSELTELPVVENSQLFAQRTVRPAAACPCGEGSDAGRGPGDRKAWGGVQTCIRVRVGENEPGRF